MKHHFTVVAISFCVISVAEPCNAFAKDKKINAPSIKQLIAELANQNTPPAITRGGQAAQFPPDYDWVEQARVISVWEQIHNRTEETLPDLVAHVDDKEYCVSFPHYSTGAWKNHSVGNICWYILSANVDVYQRPTTHGFCHSIPRNSSRSDSSNLVREWWDPRKEMALAELQLEAISVARKEHPMRKEVPNGGPISDKRRKEDIERLDKLTAKIKDTGKPISVKALDLRETTFENYPWPPKK